MNEQRRSAEFKVVNGERVPLRSTGLPSYRPDMGWQFQTPESARIAFIALQKSLAEAKKPSVGTAQGVAR